MKLENKMKNISPFYHRAWTLTGLNRKHWSQEVSLKPLEIRTQNIFFDSCFVFVIPVTVEWNIQICPNR